MIYVHRVKFYCIDYSLHRLPMRTIANYFHLDWLPGQLPTDLSAGAKGKGGRYKKRELRTHWVPGGDQETGQPNERTNTNEQLNERTNNWMNGRNGLPRREAAERTPSYRRTPVVDWSKLILPELRDVSLLLSLYVPFYIMYMACGVLIPCLFTRGLLVPEWKKLHWRTIETREAADVKWPKVHNTQHKGK